MADAEASRRWRARNPERSRRLNTQATRARRAQDPRKANLANRTYYSRNRDAQRLRVFARKHGLSLEEAQSVRAARPAACQICGAETSLEYDHDHRTDRHRGWLCSACNLGLGKFADDPQRLRAAANYLEESWVI